MNSSDLEFPYYLVDIDGTLTQYKPGSLDRLVHGNFLFPIISDMMVERGWEREKAEAAILELTQRVIYWDYTDFLSEFRLPAQECHQRFRQWHLENMLPCDDGVALVRKLHAKGATLFIMSNNPYVGCVFKLQVAGLAEDNFASPYFARIFGTNLLRGCKNDPEVWYRALAQIPAPPEEICVIGDNPYDDREVPASCGIPNSIILDRTTIVRGIDKDEE